jgi:undecaprenol kinase
MKNYTFIKSFGYAIAGIYHAICDNRNMKVHLFIAAFVIAAGLYFQVTRGEFIVLMVLILFVLTAEMINTSIEEMTDLITTEHRREAQIAKDVAAGTVLVTAVGAAIIGLYIFIPYFVRFIGS